MVVEVGPGIFFVCSAFVGIFKNLVWKIMACGSEAVNVYWREPTDRDPRRLGKGGTISKTAYASSHHHQNDSCIKSGNSSVVRASDS